RHRGQGPGPALRTRRLPRRTEVDHRRARPLRHRLQPLRAGAPAGAAEAGRKLAPAPRGGLTPPMSRASAAVLADAILALHVGVVAFVVLGTVAILTGGPLGWRWVQIGRASCRDRS